MTKTMPGQQSQTPNTPTPIRYCLYARKSTESDELQIMSIDSQIKEMGRIAERDHLNVIEIRRESHSAKASGQRPIYNQLVDDLKKKQFDGILTWAPDRLSRNAGDLGILVDLMDQKVLREIRTYSQTFTNDPNQKFLLMILGSQAKLENDNRSINTKRGMRARVEMGLWPCIAATGYLNEKRTDKKCSIIVDPERASTVTQMFERIAKDGWSGRKVHMWLRDIKFTTRNNKLLTLSNVYRVLQNHFYYGQFEYPKNSNNWYTGQHKPLISKETFNLVQDRIRKDISINYASKEFAFVKILKCGHCGSGITAQEKFKKLKDGTTNRYVYYGCTRARDINCSGGYIREDDLIKQILEVIDTLNVDKLGIRYQFEQEVERYQRFQQGVLGKPSEDVKKLKEDNIRNYAKYILQNGQIDEKRMILINFKNMLLLKDKKVISEQQNMEKIVNI